MVAYERRRRPATGVRGGAGLPVLVAVVVVLLALGGAGEHQVRTVHDWDAFDSVPDTLRLAVHRPMTPDTQHEFVLPRHGPYHNGAQVLVVGETPAVLGEYTELVRRLVERGYRVRSSSVADGVPSLREGGAWAFDHVLWLAPASKLPFPSELLSNFTRDGGTLVLALEPGAHASVRHAAQLHGLVTSRHAQVLIDTGAGGAGWSVGAQAASGWTAGAGAGGLGPAYASSLARAFAQEEWPLAHLLRPVWDPIAARCGAWCGMQSWSGGARGGVVVPYAVPMASHPVYEYDHRLNTSDTIPEALRFRLHNRRAARLSHTLPLVRGADRTVAVRAGAPGGDALGVALAGLSGDRADALWRGKGENETLGAGAALELVTAVQLAQQGRVLVTASRDMWRDAYASVNRGALSAWLGWAQHETGEVAVERVRLRRLSAVSESGAYLAHRDLSEDTQYTVLETVELAVDLREWDAKAHTWGAYIAPVMAEDRGGALAAERNVRAVRLPTPEHPDGGGDADRVLAASDLQAELIYHDARMRFTLHHDPATDPPGRYAAHMRLPDYQGVYKLRLLYRRPGYSPIHLELELPVAPLAPAQLARLVPDAAPYYAVASAVPAVSALVACVFMCYSGQLMAPDTAADPRGAGLDSDAGAKTAGKGTTSRAGGGAESAGGQGQPRQRRK